MSNVSQMEYDIYKKTPGLYDKVFTLNMKLMALFILNIYKH